MTEPHAHPSLEIIGILVAVAHASWPGCYALSDVPLEDQDRFLAYLDTLDLVAGLLTGDAEDS